MHNITTTLQKFKVLFCGPVAGYLNLTPSTNSLLEQALATPAFESLQLII